MSFVPGTHFYRQKTKYTKPAPNPVPTSTNQCFLAPKIGANDLAMQVQDVAKSPAPLQRPSRVAPVSFSVLT